MRLVRLLPLLLAAACSGADPETDGPKTDTPTDGVVDTDTPVDTDTGTTTTETVPCEISVRGAYPADGATDVFFRVEVRFNLDTEVETAAVHVTDGAGTEVPGTSTVEGTMVRWSGDPLDPNTNYTATVDFGCGTDSVSWTTSPTGGPVLTDPAGLVYDVDLAGGQWVEPPGVGELIAAQLGGTRVLLSPTARSADTIEMLAALGTVAGQDPCNPTIAFPPADWADPYFEITAPVLPLGVGGFVFDIEDARLSGAFVPDASAIEGGTLAGTVDTRPLNDMLGLGTAPDATCQLLSTFGVSCVACSDGSGDYCMTVFVDTIDAPLILGETLVERTEEDIAADPTCY